MNFTKTPTAAGIVTAAAFAASAAHIVKVVDATNPIGVALAYPIGIDGLIFVGIRAMQTGRKGVGAVALFIGAAYSLLFNAHAEGALTMHPMLIAASMPVAFFAAVLIETTAKPAVEAEPEVRVVEKIVEKVVPPALLPIAPLAPKAAPKAPTYRRPVSAAPVSPAAGRTGAGRIATWDVEKAVEIIKDEDGRTNEEIAAVVGTNAKAVQRTRRAYVLITTTDKTDEEINVEMKNSVSVAHIARVRAAA